MIIRRKKRRMPALNTTSTADISFMLLIFFLVTTSMDIDKGLARQLPPIDKQKEVKLTDISRNNVLSLAVTADNQLLADGQPIEMDAIRKRVVEFVIGCPDRQNHVISVDVDRSASYDTYFNLQNEVVAAYRVLRNDRAKKLYGRSFRECDERQKEELRVYYPQRIAEVYHPEEGGER